MSLLDRKVDNGWIWLHDSEHHAEINQVPLLQLRREEVIATAVHRDVWPFLRHQFNSLDGEQQDKHRNGQN